MVQQSYQTVRLLVLNETRQVPIHTDQGGPPVVYWGDIELQFSHTTLALHAGSHIDFERDYYNRVLNPLRIKAQHPAEIVVQPKDADRRDILNILDKNHSENIAQHKIGQAMIDGVLKEVKSGIRAMLELPDHSIPRMFIIVPEPTASLSPAKNVYRSYRLFFLCECGDSTAAASSIDGGISQNMHFAHHEGYEVKTPKAFIERYGNHILTLLQAIQKLGTVNKSVLPPILKVADLSADMQRLLKVSNDANCLPRIKFIAEHLESVLNSPEDIVKTEQPQILNGPDLRALETYLIRKDDTRALGNLHRILTPENKIKWVCEAHVRENAKVSDMGVLQHTVRTFSGTLDEKRGRVTARLSADNAERFFGLIGKESLIQELDLTLDWGPTTEQVRKLRHAIKFSQVSSLNINIDISESKYLILGVVKIVSGGGQLLKLVEFEKVGKAGPFRNLSIKGVPNILEGYEFHQCLAYSLALDRVSFKWEREKSRRRLLELLDRAPDLSKLRLCCNTLSTGYTMVRELARRSHRLTTIEITTDLQERVEFDLKAGAIEIIDATIQVPELGTVATWGDKVERLSIMASTDGHWSWSILENLISKRRSLIRLDLQCPISNFCLVFQQVQAAVGPESSLENLCLRDGDGELLIRYIHDPVGTTTIKMKPEQEQHLGFWQTFTLFGFFPAYDSAPCQMTDEQLMTLQGYFSRATTPVRLKELNLDLSKLSDQGLERLHTFLVLNTNINIRLSGPWSRNIHSFVVAPFGKRLTGFDMSVLLSGMNPLADGATTLFEALNLIREAVSVQGAKLKFTTDKGNAIDLPNLYDPSSATFDIIREGEPFDFALTRYFGPLPPKVFCDGGFSDADVGILREKIAEYPNQLRYLSMSIKGLSITSMNEVETMIRALPKEIELRIIWNESEAWDAKKLDARVLFLSKLAYRTHELDLLRVGELDLRDKEIPKWPVLRSLSIRNAAVTDSFSTWMRSMLASATNKLTTVRIADMRMVDTQWTKMLKEMNFTALKSVRITNSCLPATQLQDLVDRIPSGGTAGGGLQTLVIDCDEAMPKKSWLGRRKTPDRIPFQALVCAKSPKCNVTINYIWK
ncbi:MAG: hypothetical protein J3R72DRAFT_442689 [Linnemannia gamsii]|nr:MAG: hypothetical protein J3R72DRAFT_442689 [Linnemannia gamsii]